MGAVRHDVGCRAVSQVVLTQCHTLSMGHVTDSRVGMAMSVDGNLLTDSGLNPNYFLRRIPYL